MHADLQGAKHELHRITEVLYESCWRLARTTLEHDVSVTSFLCLSRVTMVPSHTERSIEFLKPARSNSLFFTCPANPGERHHKYTLASTARSPTSSGPLDPNYGGETGSPNAVVRGRRGVRGGDSRVEPWLDTSTPDLDTIPTPRHSDTSVSIDTRPDTPTPVSGQCQAILTLDIIGWRQAVSMVSKQNRHSDTRHPRHPRHPRHSTLPTLRHYRPRC
jgi:hypothetical protein